MPSSEYISCINVDYSPWAPIADRLGLQDKNSNGIFYIKGPSGSPPFSVYHRSENLSYLDIEEGECCCVCCNEFVEWIALMHLYTRLYSVCSPECMLAKLMQWED